MTKKCGFIAFLGAPNAGKSTLLNNITGCNLAIATPKAQTTRSRITGAHIHNQAQLIFVDVPGVFKAKKKFEKAMVNCAWTGVGDADIVVLLIDAKKGLNEDNLEIISRLKETGKPAILVLNKIDISSKERLLALAKDCNEHYEFMTTFMISALKGDGINDILDFLSANVAQGEWLYEEDYLTDLSERFIASEITRGQLFLRLREELPYGLTVESESWEEKKDGSIKIDQIIYVEREGHKKIILGAGGSQLKQIGETARKEIGKLLDKKIHLFLFIKIRPNWKETPENYKYLGLEMQK